MYIVQSPTHHAKVDGELILHQISNLVNRGDIHVSLLYRDCIFTGTGPDRVF